MCLYLDESGSRKPDREAKEAARENDFFAVGGVLVNEEDAAKAEELHRSFMAKWALTSPLHSVKIRHSKDQFRWLRDASEGKKQEFYNEITELLCNSNVLCFAAVIDRPWYNARYLKEYGSHRWRLCKTAFPIVAERAARYAREQGRKLRVYHEECTKSDDAALKRYYDEMRDKGMPFGQDNSAKYRPLSAAELKDTLYDLKRKKKTSPLVQLADLVLFPMGSGGYNPNYKTYQTFRERGLLIDCHLEPEQVPYRGIKYSCFDLVHSQDAQKALDARAEPA